MSTSFSSNYVTISFKDSDGDVINMRNNEDWQHCVKKCANFQGDIKLEVNNIHFQMLRALLDT